MKILHKSQKLRVKCTCRANTWLFSYYDAFWGWPFFT